MFLSSKTTRRRQKQIGNKSFDKAARPGRCASRLDDQILALSFVKLGSSSYNFRISAPSFWARCVGRPLCSTFFRQACVSQNDLFINSFSSLDACMRGRRGKPALFRIKCISSFDILPNDFFSRAGRNKHLAFSIKKEKEEKRKLISRLGCERVFDHTAIIVAPQSIDPHAIYFINAFKVFNKDTRKGLGT